MDTSAHKRRKDERADEAVALADYYTREECAAALGLKFRTFTLWEATGQAPPSVQLGMRRFYRKETVAQWLRDMERPTRPPRRRRRMRAGQ